MPHVQLYASSRNSRLHRNILLLVELIQSILHVDKLYMLAVNALAGLHSVGRYARCVWRAR